MQANAAASMRDEPGCLQFDVGTGPDHTVFLYEVYTDEAAFGAHLQTPLFKSFDAAVAEMIAVKDVRAYTRLCAQRSQVKPGTGTLCGGREVPDRLCL